MLHKFYFTKDVHFQFDPKNHRNTRITNVYLLKRFVKCNNVSNLKVSHENKQLFLEKLNDLYTKLRNEDLKQKCLINLVDE